MKSVSEAIDAAVAAKREPFRPHYGASQAGQDCQRRAWYSFRWAKMEEHPGRLLRLFDFGHGLEPVVYDWLERASLHAGAPATIVGKDKQNQISVKLSGHVGGSCDGVITSFAPGFGLDPPTLLEIKSHNERSFKDLKRHGVEKSKRQHYVQMQLYMLGLGLAQALYVAMNKNDHGLYTEIVMFDRELAEREANKARLSSLSNEAPLRISNDPTWYQCGWCPYREICHGIKPSTQVNCRTCALSSPQVDGAWFCGRWQATIPTVDDQRKGCGSHQFHPNMVPWERLGSDAQRAVYVINGKERNNGETSSEGLKVYSTRIILDRLGLKAEEAVLEDGSTWSP